MPNAARVVKHTPPSPPPGGRGGPSRLKPLLDAAARRFRQAGYDGASMRDIAGDVGMLPGSVYYHFPSKEELFVAVLAEGIRHITEAVEAAVAGAADPWDRLAAAAGAHMTALLDGGDYAQVVIRDARPHGTHPDRLIAHRDAYEDIFRRLIDDLPLSADADRTRVRLMLLGALNASPGWYRPGGATPDELGRDFVAMLKKSLSL